MAPTLRACLSNTRWSGAEGTAFLFRRRHREIVGGTSRRPWRFPEWKLNTTRGVGVADIRERIADDVPAAIVGGWQNRPHNTEPLVSASGPM